MVRLLVVDGLNIICDGIKCLINNQEGMEVIATATTHKEAIAFLKKNPKSVDVVVIDTELPDKCGFESVKQIKKINSKLSVLAFSLDLSRVAVIDMLKAGALGYVLKLDEGDLIKGIKEVAKKNQFFSSKIAVTMIGYIMDERGKKEDTVLSFREIEIIEQIANGLTAKETGDALCISSRTVETHRRRILKKLDIKNTAELISYAISNQIITID